jgi:ribosomal protein L14E/L6E/L27E
MRGSVVRSLAGHDRGELFCVVDVEEPYLLLCDGKGRRLARPKRKKRRHTAPAGDFDHPALGKLARREPVTDNELRRALAAFRVKEG